MTDKQQALLEAAESMTKPVYNGEEEYENLKQLAAAVREEGLNHPNLSIPFIPDAVLLTEWRRSVMFAINKHDESIEAFEEKLDEHIDPEPSGMNYEDALSRAHKGFTVRRVGANWTSELMLRAVGKFNDVFIRVRWHKENEWQDWFRAIPADSAVKCNDWFIYGEPEPGMTFIEALPKLKEGEVAWMKTNREIELRMHWGFFEMRVKNDNEKPRNRHDWSCAIPIYVMRPEYNTWRIRKACD